MRAACFFKRGAIENPHKADGRVISQTRVEIEQTRVEIDNRNKSTGRSPNTPQGPHVNPHVRPEFTCEFIYGSSRAPICEFTCAVSGVLSCMLALTCDPTRVRLVVSTGAATCATSYVSACVAVLNYSVHAKSTTCKATYAARNVLTNM